MENELKEKGKLIIYGINFETNSSTIKEESNATLDELVEYVHLFRQLRVDFGKVGSKGNNGKLI
jgi:outer membrane protein OmpA-like peptidoglycan-associated protein